METVLAAYDFGPNFKQWIHILYQNPVAAIKLYGLISVFFFQ